ncbi:c-type cytochrome [Fulvivirga sediminis]|uniref:C-type cytochrome n=1 Tax=Fulvivirga sediminis TaxID=2803949 RepID=A0A937F341_9BACT|nr:c-type cytochrome [Fulvivirga sediminis]MBL3655442.1 c-type cytochrome [Fulvivirga sediminis]
MAQKISLKSVFLALVLLSSFLFSYSSQAQEATEEAATEAPAEGGSNAPSEVPTDEARISEGKSLFDSNCKTCHRVHEKLVGPALKNVYNRAPSIDWIVNFVHNSSKVIASGDDYANKLYKEYNQTQMTAFPSFSKDEILSILGYIKQQTDKGPEVAAAAQPAAGAGDAAQSGSAIPEGYLNAIMIGLIVVLVLILVVLLLITTVLRKYLNQRTDLDEDDAELVNAQFSLSSTVKSTPFIFIVTFLFAAIAFKVVINNLFAVGIQQGYAPKQPIAFSHKIHAGQYEIDCNYCHTGVRKSRSANIPSPNICMNCHSAVKTESPEIQKIYAAIENDKPIEWVRIHNLPDLSYFNHSQHVKVGGIECQTCHGEIQEMEVVHQEALLTMGWCIDCHRKTDVNTKGNEYYDNLVELHNAESKDALKVENIGGLECAKCHY